MNKKSNAIKVLITSIFMVILIIVLVGISVNPNRLMGSVYNINDLNTNIKKIKIGDSIKYEINGYSDWKVIYIDKVNGTIDVVSKDNVSEITISDKDDFDNALDIFQTEADKYVDGKYAIKARSVNRSDLENFAFGKEFWTADKYDKSIAYSAGKIEYVDPSDFSNDLYFLPYIQYHLDNTSGYEQGDIYTKDIGGISEWFIIEVWGDSLWLMPKDPIAIDVLGNEQMLNDPYGYIDAIFNDYRQSDSNVWETGHVLQRYGNDRINYITKIKNYYASKSNPYKILRGWFGDSSGEGYKSRYYEIEKYVVERNYLECCYSETYSQYQPVTKGFRPVVTLKLTPQETNKKEANTDLSVGDYVNYSAQEYKNWRVLSIDKANNTVDIISGGIVKNLYLRGKDDYENYEDTLQKEVDNYKNGDKVINARAVVYSDLANLNKINDKVNAKYWINSKRQFNKKSVEDTSSPYNGNGYFNVGIMFYNLDNAEIEKNWVSLYIAPGQNNGNNFFLSGYNGVGELSFTAGIRPVITLKLDNVEKLDEESTNNIIKESNEKQKTLTNEQSNNPETTKDEIEEEKENNSIDNNGNINNYYNDYGEDGLDDGLIKYILIGLILINLFIFAQVILSAIIFKKMKKK